MSLHFRAFSDFICIFGRKEQGKTYFARYIVKNLSSFVIWDRNYEYGEHGFCVYYPERILPAWNEGFKKIIYQPMNASEEEFDRLCKVIIGMQNLTFVVEEVDEHAHSHGYSSKTFQTIIRTGRHRNGIGLIVLSRSPFVTHKDLRRNADYVVIFNMHEENDIKYIAHWIGIYPNYNRIKELPPWHSLLFVAREHKVIPQSPC